MTTHMVKVGSVTWRQTLEHAADNTGPHDEGCREGWRRLDGLTDQAECIPGHDTNCQTSVTVPLSETQQVLTHGSHSFSACKGTESSVLELRIEPTQRVI